MAVNITFLGGEETGNVAETVWHNPDGRGHLALPIRQAVFVDPEDPANARDRDFLRHVVRKASKSRFFRVEEADAPDVEEEIKPRRRGRPPKADDHVEDTN